MVLWGQHGAAQTHENRFNIQANDKTLILTAHSCRNRRQWSVGQKEVMSRSCCSISVGKWGNCKFVWFIIRTLISLKTTTRFITFIVPRKHLCACLCYLPCVELLNLFITCRQYTASIIYTVYSLRVAGGPVPAESGREAECSLDKSAVYHQAVIQRQNNHIHPYGQFRAAN